MLILPPFGDMQMVKIDKLIQKRKKAHQRLQEMKSPVLPALRAPGGTDIAVAETGRLKRPRYWINQLSD